MSRLDPEAPLKPKDVKPGLKVWVTQLNAHPQSAVVASAPAGVYVEVDYGAWAGVCLVRTDRLVRRISRKRGKT